MGLSEISRVTGQVWKTHVSISATNYGEPYHTLNISGSSIDFQWGSWKYPGLYWQMRKLNIVAEFKVALYNVSVATEIHQSYLQHFLSVSHGYDC